jgi:hypothetical protein
MSATNAFGFTYATGDEQVDVAAIKALADSIGPYSNSVWASVAGRDATITSPFEGQEAWTLDTGTKWFHDGTRWVEFNKGMLRVATTKRIVNSGLVVAEATIDSVAFSAIAGYTYAITYWTRGNSSVSGDTFTIQLREDSISGTVLASENFYNFQTTGGYGAQCYAEWTAAATAAKTIAGTLARFAGTGNISSGAASNIPTYLTVDRIG